MTRARNDLPQRVRPRKVNWVLAAIALVVVSGAVWGGLRHAHREALEDRLLATLPDDIVSHPALVRAAVEQARPLFASHCAACHGQDLRGNRSIGAPDLADRVWLYGSGSVYDIERTILYGVRTGLSKTRNVTDMPGYGLRGRLTPAQIRSVVQYLLALNGRAHVAEEAADGRALYYGVADCGDCHGSDARGDSDYGSPDLTINVWNNGGDPQSLYDSIYFGRHRIMPAWIGKLSLEQIRALAVYVYAASHGPAAAQPLTGRQASALGTAAPGLSAATPGAAP